MVWKENQGLIRMCKKETTTHPWTKKKVEKGTTIPCVMLMLPRNPRGIPIPPSLVIGGHTLQMI